MKKNRYLLYLLLAALMIYFAMPRISFHAGGKETLFAGSWIFFALLVFAGNLAAFLYTPRKDYSGSRSAIGAKTRKKSRMFTG